MPFTNACCSCLPYICLPLVFPSVSFCRHHVEHHSYLGVIGRDLDLAPLVEVDWVGHSRLRKMFWKSMYMFSYGLRPLGWAIKEVRLE